MFRLSAHPELHPVFEALAYATGYGVFKLLRKRSGDVLGEAQRWSIIVAAMLGALIGSRALGLIEQAPRIHISLIQAFLPGGGKTIVGGLVGGWLAVEMFKRFQHIYTRTGDLFAIPLCAGIAVGRMGCLLAGLADDTYGKATGLPWAVDFGDGVPRHPTQAYEIIFLLALALLLHVLDRRPHRTGALFQVFLGSYLAWRLSIDFLKPQPLVDGLNMIQWACCGGLMVLVIQIAVDWRYRADVVT